MENNNELKNAQPSELAAAAVKILLEKKALDVRMFNVTDKTSVTDYYVNDARRKGIKLTAKLNVARDIVISDYELCSIVGNVLDNAVAAAEKAAEPNSEILFVADTKKNGDLYIAVSNPYSGEIKEKGGKFSSTKAGGHGIGLESIRAIVQKNNGYCNFRYDKKKFYSEIMLRQG